MNKQLEQQNKNETFNLFKEVADEVVIPFLERINEYPEYRIMIGEGKVTDKAPTLKEIKIKRDLQLQIYGLRNPDRDESPITEKDIDNYVIDPIKKSRRIRIEDAFQEPFCTDDEPDEDGDMYWNATVWFKVGTWIKK